MVNFQCEEYRQINQYRTPKKFKKEINKTLSEALTIAASNEIWKDHVCDLRSTQR